jgi:hypothetical protein
MIHGVVIFEQTLTMHFYAGKLVLSAWSDELMIICDDM